MWPVNYRLNLDLEFISQLESGIWVFGTGLWNLVVSKKNILLASVLDFFHVLLLAIVM